MLKRITGRSEIMERLLQLYLHDISLYYPMDIDQNTCLYQYDDLEKFLGSGDDAAVYLIEIENKPTGFILVGFADGTNIVQEMFVLNNYKRRGVGSAAVIELFDKHRGNWEVKALPRSEQAESFWINTINKYTHGNYNVERIGVFNRAAITFNNQR